MHQSLFKQKPKMYQYKKSCPSLQNQMFVCLFEYELELWIAGEQQA